MGKEFGKLQKLWGATFYVLSPHELKPLKGIFVPGIANTFRRFRENFFFIGFPIIFTYVVIDSLKSYHKSLHRKNPDDYKDDV